MTWLRLALAAARGLWRRWRAGGHLEVDVSKRDRFATFGKVGLGVARVLVPGVAQAEAAVREAASGEAKRRTVLDLVTGHLVSEGYLSDPAIVTDQEFQDGLRLMNDGAVKLMRAIERHEQDGR